MSSTAETVLFVTPRRGHMPSRAWYWVAVAILVLGVSLGVAWGVVSTVRTHDHARALPRTHAPGTLEVRVDDGASRLIYFEGDGRPDVAALGLTVTAPDGSAVPVEPYKTIMDYDVAGWIGSPIASFATPVEGTYTVSAQGSYGQGAVSVGDDFLRTQAIDIVGALAVAMASFVVGVVLAIVVWVKRSSRVQAARPSP
jgi:hypothetical protein